VTQLLFQHHPGMDETTVSLIVAHTPEGAGLLSGQPAEPIDLNAANQTSILELLEELRFTAVNAFDPGPGTSFDLVRDWGDSRHKDTSKYLDVSTWRFKTLFGTSYEIEQPDAFYVWTDIGFEVTNGDVTGDESIDDEDRDALADFIEHADGEPGDGDGRVNAQVTLIDHAFDFSLYDLDGDGRVNSLDAYVIGFGRRGDMNADGDVDEDDVRLVRALLGLVQGDPAYNPAADLNHNGVIDRRDCAMVRRMSRQRSIGPGQ